jgi:hypothetical protein
MTEDKIRSTGSIWRPGRACTGQRRPERLEPLSLRTETEGALGVFVLTLWIWR